ncbi:hypothetical protein M0812_14623 [Anaeramoeba flamelloides]|uniref:Mannosyltransferase n=1 Tax=Anaeramoeba flamelloides TaxID=1746091 RepID=A0AAV7ZA85_9EUKA|nr:hypothetical protein M0812_14623 [Anaeramoeba flamelloides]
MIDYLYLLTFSFLSIFLILYLLFYKKPFCLYEIISLSFPLCIVVTIFFSLSIRYLFKQQLTTFHVWALIAIWICILGTELIYLEYAKAVNQNQELKQKSKLIFKVFLQEMQEHYQLYLVQVILFPIFLWILTNSILRPHPMGTFTMKNSYGDLPFHMTLIESFLRGCNSKFSNYLDFQFPFFYDEQLTYPFFADYFSALLVSSGAALRTSIILPSALLFYSFVCLLYSLNYRLFQSKCSASVSVLLVIFSGGIGFLKFLFNFKSQGNSMNLLEFKFQYDYVYKIGKDISYFWLGFLDATLVPQRTSLLGYPLSLAALILCHQLVKKSMIKKYEFRMSILMSLIVGFLPLSHTHSYIATGFITGLYFIFCFPFASLFNKIFKKSRNQKENDPKNENENENENEKRTRKRKPKKKEKGKGKGKENEKEKEKENEKDKEKEKGNENEKEKEFKKTNGASVMKYLLYMFVYAILANLIALPQLLPFIKRTTSNISFLKYEPIWNGKGTNPLLYLFQSLGPILSLTVLGFLLLLILKKIKLLCLLIPQLLLFIICLYIKFQPWNYDNIKLMNFSIIAFAGVSGYFLVWLIKIPNKISNNKIKKCMLVICCIVTITLLIASIFSGALSVISLKDNKYQLQSQYDIEVGEWVAQNIQSDAVFVTYNDDHKFPFTTIAGMKQVAGYSGWLWSHGINYGLVQRDSKRMLTAPEYTTDEQLIQYFDKFRVTHIWESNFDLQKISNRVIDVVGFRLIYDRFNIKIYEKI